MKVYAPLGAKHPAVTIPLRCPVPGCGETFRVGDVVTLWEIGPATLEDSVNAAKGKPYTAECVPAHAECVSEAGLDVAAEADEAFRELTYEREEGDFDYDE